MFLENILFSKQVLRKLFSVENLPNMFLSLKNTVKQAQITRAQNFVESTKLLASSQTFVLKCETVKKFNLQLSKDA